MTKKEFLVLKTPARIAIIREMLTVSPHLRFIVDNYRHMRLAMELPPGTSIKKIAETLNTNDSYSRSYSDIVNSISRETWAIFDEIDRLKNSIHHCRYCHCRDES